VTLAMISCRSRPHEPLLGPTGMAIFFVLNVVNVLVAFACAFQRRRALRQATWPMSPAWASLTFPLASNCTVAVRYASEYSFVSEPWAIVAAYWSQILVPITLILIPCTDLLWVAHLPNWFCVSPPLRSPSIDQGTRTRQRRALLDLHVQSSDCVTPEPSPDVCSTMVMANAGGDDRRAEHASAAHAKHTVHAVVEMALVDAISPVTSRDDLPTSVTGALARVPSSTSCDSLLSLRLASPER